MLYENHHRKNLAKKWYSNYRAVRRHGDFTFDFQHDGTEIENKIHANDIQLARELT